MQKIEDYHPNTSVKSLVDTLDSPQTKEEVFELWKKLVNIVHIQNASFLAIGKILKIFRDNELYKHLDYPSFSQFLNSEEISFSREKAYMCIRIFEYYVENLRIDPDKMTELSIARLSLMMPVVKQIEAENGKGEATKKVFSFTNLRHNDFVKEIKELVDKGGKPVVYWSDEKSRWYVGYFSNTCYLESLGEYEGKE